MAKRSRTLPIIVVLAVIAGMFGFVFFFGVGENLIEGNIVRLSLVENFRDINCDAFNEIGIINTNGAFSIVGSGKSGFNPSFESSLLDVTAGGQTIKAIKLRLVLACDGNFIRYSTAPFGSTTVSGDIQGQICTDPQFGKETCYQGSEREATILEGSATLVDLFATFPIQQQSLENNIPKVIWEGDISATELERLFEAGDGSIHLQTTFFPVLTLTFNHQTKGVFTINYNAITANQPVIAQYGGFSITDVDTDNDGIFDLQDGCINQPETINGFEDLDGCPDTVPVLDTDGDGILDIVDFCVTDPENFNNFQDEDGCPDDPSQPVSIIDSDGDGVIDEADLCINEVGTIANAGCPEPQITEQAETVEPFADSDGDGVPNAIDACLNEAGDLLNNGCPIREEPIRISQEIPPPLFDPEFTVAQPEVQVPTGIEQIPITTTTDTRLAESETTRNIILLALIAVPIIVIAIALVSGKVKL